MSEHDDQTYFEERERHAIAAANSAASQNIRAIHEELASHYHGLALAAEFGADRDASQDSELAAKQDL